MNYKDYQIKKENGIVQIIKAGGGYAFASKRFNIETGGSEQPEIEAVDVKILEQRILDLQTEIDDIKLILVDIRAL